MKFFIDTEFLEGPQKNWLGIMSKPTIDLISIGIVDNNFTDSKEYYAISKDFNLKEAWNRFQWEKTGITDLSGINRSTVKEYWIRENVLRPLWNELMYKEYREEPNEIKEAFYEVLDSVPGNERLDFFVKYLLPSCWERFEYSSIKRLIKKYGKTNKQIAEEVKAFVYESCGTNQEKLLTYELKKNQFPIEFYGYFSGFDTVVFQWLFGNMNDLPKAFPMYFRDLQQMLDDKVESLKWLYARDCHYAFNNIIGEGKSQVADRPATKEEKIEKLKSLSYYPKQENEHNAIDDARWNKKLFKFLQIQKYTNDVTINSGII